MATHRNEPNNVHARPRLVLLDPTTTPQKKESNSAVLPCPTPRLNPRKRRRPTQRQQVHKANDGRRQVVKYLPLTSIDYR